MEQALQVVGVDGSPGSQKALNWALARADRLGPVQPVSVWHYPWWALVPTVAGTLLPPGNEELEAAAERVVVEMLDGVDPALYRDPRILHGATGPMMIEAAGDASLLVVGTRGLGAVAGSALGSVSMHVVSHAPGPVAVVAADAEVEDHYQRVVVGVDGSATSGLAVQWAIDNTPPSTAIDVVHAWQPSAAAAGVAVAEVLVLLADQAEQAGQDVIETTLAAFEGRAAETGHKLTGRSVQGDARHLLRSEAEEADLLILGAQGHRGVAHLFLGSVATAMVHHPTATTIVVR